MGVKIRQKDGKWYVFINHNGKRKAKCVGDSKKAAMEVKRKLEAKLTLGEFDLLDDKPKVRESVSQQVAMLSARMGPPEGEAATTDRRQR